MNSVDAFPATIRCRAAAHALSLGDGGWWWVMVGVGAFVQNLISARPGTEASLGQRPIGRSGHRVLMERSTEALPIEGA